MTNTTTTTKSAKAVISLAEMCRQLEMSRSHFYWHLKRGNFHQPLKLACNGRPYYTADMAQENLQVKETGINVSGEYVVFYERRPDVQRRPTLSAPRPPRPKPARQPEPDSSLAAGLRSLNVHVTSDQIKAALAACFPNGPQGEDEANVLRTVFKYFKRAESA